MEKGGQNHQRDIQRAIETCVCGGGGGGGGQRDHENTCPWNQKQRIKWAFPKRLQGGDEKHWHKSGECSGGGWHKMQPTIGSVNSNAFVVCDQQKQHAKKWICQN